MVKPHPIHAVILLLAMAVAATAADEEIVTLLVLREDGPGRRVPVPGARVSCHTEDTRAVSLGSRLVSETKANEHGVAELRVPAGVAHHWLFEAEGWGVVHEYGGADEMGAGEIVFEEPGSDRRIRVIGPFGKPLANARVEMLLGCSHGPAARVATTDGEGIAVLPNVVDSGWDLWIVAPGVRPRSYALPSPPLGGRPALVLTDQGATVTGRVVDEAGRPVAGAVVRELDGFRGPVTATSADGTFVLVGLTGEAEIGVFVPGSPHAPRPDAVARSFTPDVPLRFVLRKSRSTALGDGEPRHRLDVLLEGADSLVPIRLTRLSDGLTITGKSGLWPASFDVPPGEWRVVAGGGFSFEAPVRVVTPVPTRGGVPVRLRLETQQGAFGVRPDAARSAGTRKGELRIPGFRKEVRLDGIEWVPARAPAALALSEPHPRTVPVPVAGKDGSRFLELPPPGETRLRLRVTNRGGDGLLARVTTDDLVIRVEGGTSGACTVVTSGAGDVTLSIEADGHLGRDLEVVLPTPPAEIELETVVLRPETDLVTRTFRVLRPDGSPFADVQIAADDDRLDDAEVAEDGSLEVELAEDVRAALVADGFLPRPVVLGRRGPDEFRFPAGRLTIRVQDAAGEPLDADVWVNGWPFESDDGPIVADGVPAGVHVVVVRAGGHLVAVRKIEVAKGQQRELFVRPAPRPR